VEVRQNKGTCSNNLERLRPTCGGQRMDRIPYVIIGGGLAGVAAADAIRRRDKTGRLLLICAEAHPPYDRVPLSKDYLLGTMERDQVFLRQARFYERNKVELLLQSPVTNLDVTQRLVTLADGSQIGFDKLLLATGGRPRQLPLPGAELDGIYYLRNLEDTDAIRSALQGARQAVVIGAGFIGCELASAFAQLGVPTTVVELTPAPLSLVVDPETSAFVADYLHQKGVTILTDTAVAHFVGTSGRVQGVVTNTGKELAADLVAVGVGIAPNTELATAAGLTVDNGVVVNEYLEATEGIFAAGDMARYYSPVLARHLRVEHYDVALQHGRVAGANMTGERRAYTELPYFFSFMGDLHINVVGDMSQRAQVVRRGALGLDPGFVQFYFADGLLQAALFVNRNGDLLQAARERIAQRQPVHNTAAFADEAQELASL
jgi:3-phenylpropionate/trans-cinnamate dioxygenase ferredoxin reductase subunit